MHTTVKRQIATSGYAGLRLTADEYFALSEDGARYELLDGVVIMSPSPLLWHKAIATEIVGQLFMFLRAQPIGRVVSEVDVELPLPPDRRPIVYRPELIFLSRERWPELPDRVRGAPELVVEVVSPGSQAYDYLTKRQDYAQAGVREYWLIDPLEHCEYAFVPADAGDVPAVAGDALASLAVPGFVLDLPRVRENYPPKTSPGSPAQRPG